MDLAYETRVPTPLRNSTLLPLLLLSLARQRHTPVPSDTFKDEYDYIVGKNLNDLLGALKKNICLFY